MSEDVYVLKKKVDARTLGSLNDHQLNASGRVNHACTYYAVENEDQYIDWVHAVYSLKKIVNPLSPREELKQYVHETQDKYMADMIQVTSEILAIVAKEHPDVADWLKEDDKDA